MTYQDISALRALFVNSIENLDFIWESKSLAAQAKNLDSIYFENKFRNGEKECEEILIDNLSSIVKYVKKNMDVVSESHSGQVLNLVS